MRIGSLFSGYGGLDDLLPITLDTPAEVLP